MKGLTTDECQEWLSRHVPGAVGEEPIKFPATPLEHLHFLTQSLPADSGRKVWLAKLVFEQLHSEEEILVWFNDYLVWPSSSHVPLMLRLRESLGERRTLEEAPGSLLARDERDDGISLLVLALTFFWDCLVVGASGTRAFFTSHDEYCQFMSRDEAELEGLGKLLE